MFIKYNDCGESVIYHLPNTKNWQICIRCSDDYGRDDYSLYLYIDDKIILLGDTEYWCCNRPRLSRFAVGCMYEAVVDVIASKIENEPNLKLIDIIAIENKLLEEKYEKEWVEKGYIEIDENGCW